MPSSGFPKPSRPLRARDGITARSKRGAIGEHWWSQRFIAHLETFNVESRLKRGRTYARGGQVLELDVEPGVVLARVQGSRYTPYKVRLRCQVISDTKWRRVEKAMAAQALPLAQLLSAEMPRDIDELFEACKVSLFPRTTRELTATCSCPDWENPCKHIAAVYYLLAESFDDDPFLIFAWRGREQDQLLANLRKLRGAAVSGSTQEHLRATPTPEPSSATFWSAGPEAAEVRVNPLTTEPPDALLRQFGPLAADVEGEPLWDVLARAYPRLASAAVQRALTE
jgi:uncharacterized Zn finger protein